MWARSSCTLKLEVSISVSATLRIGIEQLALFDNGAPHRLRPAQRMRPARLRIAAHQHSVLRIEKDHARVQQLLDALRISGSRSSVAPSRTSTTMAARSTSVDLPTNAGELRQQFERKIVDAVKSKILKGLERRGFARAGDSGHDDQFLCQAFPASASSRLRLWRSRCEGFWGVMGFMLHRLAIAKNKNLNKGNAQVQMRSKRGDSGPERGSRSDRPIAAPRPAPVPDPASRGGDNRGPGPERSPCGQAPRVAPEFRFPARRLAGPACCPGESATRARPICRPG